MELNQSDDDESNLPVSNSTHIQFSYDDFMFMFDDGASVIVDFARNCQGKTKQVGY